MGANYNRSRYISVDSCEAAPDFQTNIPRTRQMFANAHGEFYGEGLEKTCFGTKRRGE